MKVAVRRHSVVRVADEIVVDPMASACGITYDEALEQDIEERLVEDVVIPLAGKRLLIRMKDTVGTPTGWTWGASGGGSKTKRSRRTRSGYRPGSRSRRFATTSRELDLGHP